MEQFNEDVSVSVVDCTLTDGTETTCYQIESMALPAFEIGPMCPETLEDIGGIWVWDGDDAGLYTLNEAFFLMVAAQGFIFFDDDGNINIVTEVGGPGSGGEPITGNNCFAQTPDETVTMTSLIPTEPIMADTPTNLGTVAQVGIGIDGVPIFADAPSVLDTGNLPALDVCGGHVDPGGWYHWHATAGDIESSFDHEGLEGVDCLYEQSTSALFAYAFDGYLIYGSTEPDGSLPEDLDECGGHLGPTPDSEEDVYHYHAGLEFPN
ncbi:MAG: YHYH protein, partial [Chloroflexota bacterium]